jgi:hypothetical protein
MYGRMVWNISSTALPGSQVTSPSRPPLRVMRANSAGGLGARDEHDTERRRNAVKTLIWKLQRFGVTDLEVDLRSYPLCCLDHAFTNIDASYLCAPT